MGGPCLSTLGVPCPSILCWGCHAKPLHSLLGGPCHAPPISAAHFKAERSICIIQLVVVTAGYEGEGEVGEDGGKMEGGQEVAGPPTSAVADQVPRHPQL